MQVLIYHLTTISYDLPDDVFATGESKPTRPKKKTVVKKRPHDGGGGTEVMHP